MMLTVTRLLLSIPLLVFIQRVTANQGLTGHPCLGGGTNTCRLPRTCVLARPGTPEACPVGSSDCACFSSLPITCSANTVCPAGERCASHPAAQFSLCVSCTTIALFNLPTHDSLQPQQKQEQCVSPAPLPPPLGPGLSGDPCRAEAADCKDNRVCLFGRERGLIPCTPDRDPLCECIPLSGLRPCSASTDCETGERCVRRGSDNAVCYGCQRAADDNTLTPVDEAADCPAPSPAGSSTPVATQTPSPSVTASTEERPRQTAVAAADVSPSPKPTVSTGPEAQGNSTAMSPTSGDVSPSSTPTAAVGNVGPNANDDEEPLVTSEEEQNESENVQNGAVESPETTSTNTEVGDVEATTSEEPGESNNNSNNSSEAVCVAVHHLQDIHQKHLVFSRHRSAEVLCDAAASCATEGHVVVWKGVPMTMRQYCETSESASCMRRRMEVNSPRFRRGMRVRAHTDGLVFTALAARWGTAAEGAALSLLARLGM